MAFIPSPATKKGENMEYPEKLRFTSKYRCYKIFFVPPTSREIDGLLVRTEGKQLEFRDWECVCTDPETIKLALKSGYYGKDYMSPDWEKMKMEEKQKEESPKTEVSKNESSVPAKVGRPKKQP